MGKTAGIVANEWPDAWWATMRGQGIEVKHFIKYPGIWLGTIISHAQQEGLMGLTIDQAFAWPFKSPSARLV